MEALLVRSETTKKDKHGRHCHDQQKHFSLFALYVNGMLGMEVLVVLVQFSQIIAAEMNE